MELERLIAAGRRRPGFTRPLGNRFDRIALFEGRVVYPRFAAHVEYSAPDEGVVFASVCNDKYAPGLEALILSLKDVYPDLHSKYLVYHDATLSAFSRQRLDRLYPHFEFHEKDPDEFAVTMGDELNHKRVGRLGYLTLHCIKIEEPNHIVILDTDLLILGDISPLWSSQCLQAVPDIGNRPYGVVSKTGHPVINSGVLSLPRSARGPQAWERARRLLALVDQDDDIDIQRFADQRFWNMLLRECDYELLPQNFNTNKTLIEGAYTEQIGQVSVLHLTGPKPWYEFLHSSLLVGDDYSRYREGRSKFKLAFTLWNNIYRRQLLKTRLTSYREEMESTLLELHGAARSRPAVMIGNGPSIAQTDLSVFEGYERFCFNWFINHKDFDEVKPHHLVVASHMLFGGWFTPKPELPAAYLDALLSHKHRPTLWFPFYFKDYIESLPQLHDFKKNYIFFEKPFKLTIADRGLPELDIRQPLVDCNTGVLTAGIPLAVHMKAKAIVLVGCDSNYSSASGSYFYAADSHKSETTRPERLIKTWVQGGEGQFGYLVTAKALAEKEIAFFDATIDGALKDLQKITLEAARALAVRPTNDTL